MRLHRSRDRQDYLVPSLPPRVEFPGSDCGDVHDARLVFAALRRSRRSTVCPEEHVEPLRVSGIASGSWSGPVGSTGGQQPFTPGQRICEEQPRFEGWLPRQGHVAIRCKMTLTSRSMAAMWLAGFEEHPDDCGELCVVEVFGRSIQDGSAEVGVGVKRKKDVRLIEDFVAPRITIDVAEFHEYGVTWNGGGAAFTIDGKSVHTTSTAPTYPLQIMIAVFDFPNWSSDDEDFAAQFDVDWVREG